MTMNGFQRRLAGRQGFAVGFVLAGVLAIGGLRQGWGQIGLPGGGQEQSAPNPLMGIAMAKPGKVLLFDLEARFAKDTKERGGAGFASWFAADGVPGEWAIDGGWGVAIEKSANWSAQTYQLTWAPTDAQMGPSGDMGYTWGHFEGRSKDANGNPVLTSGRYMTIWRKQADGSWKVVLDAGANRRLRLATAASCRIRERLLFRNEADDPCGGHP